jgi:hypothetical protein
MKNDRDRPITAMRQTMLVLGKKATARNRYFERKKPQGMSQVMAIAS